MLSVSSPLYDINKTFEENFNNPSFPSIIPPIRIWPDRVQWTSLLGYSLASKIGAAACAVTTGKGIALLAQLGFDILTYKTIRRHAHPTHPLPNIVHVECKKLLEYSDLKEDLFIKDKSKKIKDQIAISNSFGNGCLEPLVVMQDITVAKNALVDGQVLIVSVYGEGDSLSSMSQDFAAAALMAKEAGADIIELNFSCPNLMTSGEPVYWSIECVSQITAYVVKCAGDIPIVLKFGLLHEQESPLKLLVSAARAGARGISAINSIGMRVLNQNHHPAFGKRIYSGVSGYPIRRLALQSVKKLIQINQSEKLNLAILGMGGITLAEHFNEFLNIGADIALSATGMMWNPYLAAQFHQQSRS
ncbi:MAG: tRNA-dihydrouridine synthase [Candidatus Aquirickettsiella sp.]